MRVYFLVPWYADMCMMEKNLSKRNIDFNCVVVYHTILLFAVSRSLATKDALWLAEVGVVAVECTVVTERSALALFTSSR